MSTAEWIAVVVSVFALALSAWDLHLNRVILHQHKDQHGLVRDLHDHHKFELAERLSKDIEDPQLRASRFWTHVESIERTGLPSMWWDREDDAHPDKDFHDE